LPPGTRRLLEVLDGTVSERAADKALDRDQVRLTRRQLREHTGWSDTALKVHLARLVDLELVVAHRLERGGSCSYELAWDGAGRHGERFLIGLTDPASLASLAASPGYDDTRSGPEPVRSAPGQGPVRPRSGAGRGGDPTAKPSPRNASGPLGADGNGDGAAPGDAHEQVVAAAARRAG